jgi:hypothetical protein
MMEEASETPSASLREYIIPFWDDRPAKPPSISLGYKSRRDLQGMGARRVTKSKLVGDRFASHAYTSPHVPSVPRSIDSSWMTRSVRSFCSARGHHSVRSIDSSSMHKSARRCFSKRTHLPFALKNKAKIYRNAEEVEDGMRDICKVLLA